MAFGPFKGFGGASGGGASGSANVGGELRQNATQPGVGLFISTPEADPSWHIRGVERQLEEQAAEARVEIPGANDASVAFLLPLDYALGLPETLNVHDIQVTEVEAVRAAVRANAVSGALTLTENTPGFGTISFSAATGNPLKNAFARVATSGGSLDITRPDLALKARGTWPTPTVGIQIEYAVYGTVGNGFRVLIQGALDTNQPENYTVAAAYTSDTRMTVTITFNSTASTNVAYSDIAAAINLARRNNNQLVAAVPLSGSRTGTTRQSSASGSDVTLSGGGMFPGARTNVGHVETHHTGARVEGEAGAAASGTYDNKLKLTANTPGTAGNIRVVFEDWATSGSGITVAQEGARINVAFRNPFGVSDDDTTFTLASIKEAIEGFTGSGIPTFTVSYVGGASGTDTITRASSGAGEHFWDTTLTGGVDPVAAENQLRATWDEGSGILAIYALPTDPMVDVAAAILALDEFAAADLEYSTGSTPNTDVLTFSGAAAGQHHDYAFANGTDKSALALSGDPIMFPGFYTFAITGVVPGVTTAQELVDFINGLDGPDDHVTASVTSGESGTDTFGDGQITLDIAGGDAGQPAVAMSVVLAADGISLTIQTGRSLQSIASPTQYWRDEDGTPTAVAYPLDERDAAPATHTAIGILFTETSPTRPSTTISFSWETNGETGDTPQFTSLIDFPNFKSFGVTGIIPGVTTVQDIVNLFNTAGNEAFLGFITPTVASGAQGSDTIPAGGGSFDFTTGLPGEPTGNRIETGDQTAVIAALPDPFRPTGGRNYVPAGPIEVLVRGEDEADGENVEVRYHRTDTFRSILTALEAQDDITVVEIYGTSLAEFPESPPFERAMYPEGGSTEGGATFSPSKSNLYSAVKAIFHPATNPGVSADDTNSELDVSGGAGSYTLPAATESVRGGVQGATQAQAQASSGATILGWTNTRLRQLIAAALPTVSTSDAQAGTSNARRVWTAARVRTAIRAVFTTAMEAAIGRIPSANPGNEKVWKTDSSGAPGWRNESGDDNVQSNWDETDTAADSYIQNKPDLSGIGTDATARAAAAAAQTTADAALPKAGGTMTGKIILDGAPTSDLHAATKKYVDDNAGGSATGTLEARVERVNFDDLATGTANAELTPNALSVVNGAGANELLSNISGNDFTLAAGVYLVNIHASFTLTGNTVIGFAVRRASDDAELDQSNPMHPRAGTNIWSARALVVLAADTAVNVLLKRTNASASAIHAEFVQLSSGGAVHSAHNRYIGWAAQQTPSATEIAAADTFQTDVLTIPAEPADGDGWLWFAVPNDAGAPDSAYFDGNTHDILGGFTQLAAATFAGHIVYATSAEQDPADLGTGDRTLTLEYD